MIKDIDIIKDKVTSLFQEHVLNFSKVQKGNVIFSHCGFFSQDLINNISCIIEKLMFSYGDKKITIKRMFSILIEGLQNIRAHGYRLDSGTSYGSLIISKTKGNYKIKFSNLIEKTAVDRLIDGVDYINELSPEDLKGFYHTVLTEGVFSSKGGAGLGFITMKMKSDYKIDYVFESIDENLDLFSYSIVLDRISAAN